ncbi:CPBP family glutamic-type intramembrane protease [Paeniclostridium sordellii]|uniref:CPBP family glutamic-type intramembrane protease n=1 Tax=Paraclostridium sordellii TaxID=1505 RepID=UPI0005DE423A|nr:CPBP family glutamic-type intramembrane protease [Paeniclostridium sordellii]MCQ4696701.1 CPBP family glutamic-type intramembrane protease [Paeniclostridium sordellii]CEN83846.1 membrane spanning protein [[Clostridium] sordellii] [Paeniclostridium sordellii]CEO10223.1 membrane spanning protein [[Clostridium] sordellii] [Paeniclostridium sordellii]CEP89537.1 membrane spanning protein [[Clostridium] sordellii] [Paeniclostridium sordellii]
MKNNTVKLTLLFIFFISVWFIASVLKTAFIWFISINLIAIYLIIKNKSTTSKDFILGIIFGVLCMPSSPIMGISTIIPFVASIGIFKKSKNTVHIFSNDKKIILLSVILTLAIGIILGAINVFFAIDSIPINPDFKIQYVFNALRAGIFEEVFFRLFFFAMCIYITNDSKFSKTQNLLCYLIMIIPHTLIHFNLSTFNLPSVAMLSLLFGLPFALMLRKLNLISAIGAHSIVDIIRFCTFGI